MPVSIENAEQILKMMVNRRGPDDDGEDHEGSYDGTDKDNTLDRSPLAHLTRINR